MLNDYPIWIFKTEDKGEITMKINVPASTIVVGLIITIAYLGVQKIDQEKVSNNKMTAIAVEDSVVLEETVEQGETNVQDEKIIIDGVPFIQQMPELARGCEVTSLAMLLQYAGVAVDKMTLAEEINTVSFKDQNGLYGNPNDGFVGDIYSFDHSGYGVYHGPIADLAESYLPGRIIDLTGESIDTVYERVRSGSPVWVIVNSRFTSLPDSEFETWNTQSGEVEITYREHSVVVVGYDENYVYLNDPLASEPYTSVSREAFEAAWEQMGQQAISIQ